MTDWSRHPPLLRLLSAFELARTYARRQSQAARRGRENRREFYDRAWREAAASLGAEVRAPGGGILEIARAGARARVCDNYTTLDDPVTLKMAGNKPLVYRTLQDRGLPIPTYATFSLTSMRAAIEFLERSGDRPCVVKPASGTGAGQGITTGITRRSQLAWAAAAAAGLARELVIEHEVAGDNYRLLYLDGRLLDAVVRRPPSVVGDGRRSVRRLVDEENERRLTHGWVAAQGPVAWDRDMRHTLARQGLSRRLVPAPGQRVTLKTVINDNAAHDTLPVTGLCDDIIAAGAEAAAAIGVRLAGIDVITTDTGRPLHRTGGVILEVNTTPGLYHHKRGAVCPVAATLLAAMLGREAMARIA